MRIFTLCCLLALILSASVVAVPDGCAEVTATVQVESEDDSYTYYVVSTTVTPDSRAKKEKAERVALEIDASLAAEGVNKDGVQYREEVPLHFRLAGVRYGSYSRTVKGAIRGPRVNRRVLGITIQKVACVWQQPGDESEQSSVD